MAYGSMYNFSIKDFIYNIDIGILLFATTFLIITALVRFALKRSIMKKDNATASVIAVCIGLLTSYGLMKTGLSLKWMTALNISPDFLVQWLPWIVIAIAAFIIFKWGLGVVFLIFGIILFTASIFDLIYAKGFGFVLGVALILIGIKLIRARKRRKLYKGMNLKDREDYKLKRRTNQQASLQKWNNAGYKAGRKIGSWMYRKKPQQTSQPLPPKPTPRQMRTRTGNELQRKYDFYKNDVIRIMANNNRKIPQRGTPEGHRRHRDIQAMKAIENIAKKNGVKLRF
jgi:hypothetical protein